MAGAGRPRVPVGRGGLDWPMPTGADTRHHRCFTPPRHISEWNADEGLAAPFAPAPQCAVMSEPEAASSAVGPATGSRLHLVLGVFTLVVVAAAQAVLDPALPVDLLYVLPVAVIAMAGGRPLGVA